MDIVAAAAPAVQSASWGIDSPTTWAVVLVAAALAGWIDAVIGGGGLILIPVLMAAAPHLAPATVLATNKLAAVSGTASAAWVLVRRVRPPVRLLALYGAVAAAASAAGALLVTLIDAAVMRPAIIVLLVAAGAFVALRPQFGTAEAVPIHTTARRLLGLAAAAVIALYDGVFGPGTGMFLIMSLSAIFSQNFMVSAAMAKVINTCTNLGALAVFIASGHVLWLLGFALAAANILGAQVGARTVLRAGTGFIRAALLALVVVLASYLSYLELRS